MAHESARTLAKIIVLFLLMVSPCARADQSNVDLGREQQQAMVRQFVAAHAVSMIEEFRELLEIPNVYQDVPNIERNAQRIKEMLGERDIDTHLLRIDGASPIIYGRLDAPGATETIGVYLHYDGQPVDPSEWTNGDPWRAVLYSGAIDDGGHQIDMPMAGDALDPDWRIYARSASDDKAPLFTILGALDAMRALDIKPTVNLVFFFEGEEEAGSPHLAEYLSEHSNLVSDIDLWLFCDGPIHQSGHQQLVFGVRGVVGMEITVYGAVQPLHSGHYGNWAPNPALMLAQLLGSMKDSDGNVVVEGFFDTVEPLSQLERDALARVPRVDEYLMQELQLARTEGDEAYANRLLLPSLNIRGMRSANVGLDARNVIPKIAQASIDIRLVKGCDPDRMIGLVEEHIRSQGFHIVREMPDEKARRTHERIARVDHGIGYPSARTSMDLPIVQHVIDAARLSVGDDLVLMPSLGGSLPIYLFTDGLGQPVVICPVANHDNNQHAADENIRLGNLFEGIELMTSLFTMTE